MFSSVIYTEINGYKFMFMGDAGVEVENDLIEKYNVLPREEIKEYMTYKEGKTKILDFKLDVVF